MQCSWHQQYFKKYSHCPIDVEQIAWSDMRSGIFSFNWRMIKVEKQNPHLPSSVLTLGILKWYIQYVKSLRSTRLCLFEDIYMIEPSQWHDTESHNFNTTFFSTWYNWTAFETAISWNVPEVMQWFSWQNDGFNCF